MSSLNLPPNSPNGAQPLRGTSQLNRLQLSTAATPATDRVEIPLPNLLFGRDPRFNSITLTGLDEATFNANKALLGDRDAMTKISIKGSEAIIIDPNELLERIVHCKRTGGKVLDGRGDEISNAENFIAEYSRDLLAQFKELGVFNLAKHCIFDVSTGRATYHDGFNAPFEDVISKERIVWVDAVLKREFRFLHNSASGYILQRICAAALLQKPKTAGKVANANASRKLAVTKLPFPAVKDGLLYLPEAHIAAGEGVIFTVRSSRVDRIDKEFEQFLTGNVTTSGCIIEYLILRSGDGMKNARDLFWSEIRKIEAMQTNAEEPSKILKRIALVEDVASNLIRTANRVSERLKLEAVTITELYPGLNFADKWLANWTASTNGLSGIIERLAQERSQIEAQIQSEEATKAQRAAETYRRSTNVLAYAVTTAGIIQALSFVVGDNASLFVRAACTGIVAGGVALVTWLGLRHQSKIGSLNKDKSTSRSTQQPGQPT